MKPEYNTVHVKMGKMSKAVSASKVEVDGVPLGDIVKENQALRQAFKEQADVIKEALSNALVIPKDKDMIVALDGELHKGKLQHAQPYNGEQLSILRFKDGKLKIKDEIGEI